MAKGFFTEARLRFHASLLRSVLTIDSLGVPTNADRHSPASVQIAKGILGLVGSTASGYRLAGQSSGRKFETICTEFIRETFLRLTHLRPGLWEVASVGSRNRLLLAQYEQYAHLVALDRAARKDPELAAALGNDYTMTPDIIVSRAPEEDRRINVRGKLVDDRSSLLASLRKKNSALPILHASISCKWTIRSDRSQNARSEALNLIRNRKGHLPHVIVVTAEPLPSRISSIALGTGDIDCVYHFALPELVATVKQLNAPDSEELLAIMTNGKRLRDISDIPLDLAV